MILTNCRLIPELCEGFQEEMADIRIEGNAIAEILPAGGHYTGEEVIDCTGKTVLPGLFNVHAHLFFNGFGLSPQTEYQHVVNHMRYMNELLAYGYTSIRDMGGPYGISIKFRDAINAGTMIGPDIKACNHILTPTCVNTGLECYSNMYGMAINSPYEARAVARKQITEGADFIKILGSSIVDTARRGNDSLFYPDEMEAIKEVVKYERSYLAIHAIDSESNSFALASDARTIEHAFFWNQENTDKLIADGNKTALIPTLQVWNQMWGYDKCKADTIGLRTAYDAGVLIGLGTDTPEPGFLAEPQSEFVLRTQVWGISAVEVFKQATINSAKINRTDDIRGSIKVGKRADFAIIDGKPDEDLDLLGKPCAYVLKDGVVVARNGFVKSI